MHWPVLWKWDKRRQVLEDLIGSLICSQKWDEAAKTSTTLIRLLTQSMPKQESLYRVGQGMLAYETVRWRWGDYPIPYQDWKEMCKRAEDF